MVTVYSKTATFCGMCKATERSLTNRGVDFEVKPLEDTNPAQIAAWQAQGLLAAPIVVTGDQVWSGFRPDLIETLVAA